jgi:hypothetical protein
MTIDLESRTAGLFQKADQWLGDTITVTPPNGDPITLKANVDYGEVAQSFGTSAAVTQAVQIDLDKALVPGKPDVHWLISLPRFVGSFSPRDVRQDRSGLRWEFGIKEVQS